jgi:hypothetical protein
LPEALICLGGFGWFATLFLLFIKFFPCMAISESMQSQHAREAMGAAPHG